LFNNFFDWFNRTKEIENSRQNLEENIYSVIEIFHVGYNDVLDMPYTSFLGILKWKSDLEEERKKKMEEKINENKSRLRKSRRR